MQLFYSESGTSHLDAPLVLLHGFCETHQVWKHFEQTLSNYCRVLSPDLPGFGGSPLPAGNFRLPDVAEVLHSWLKELGINRCILLGHSLGGYVSLAFLEQYPQMVEGIGLMNSTAYADTEEKKQSRGHVIRFVEKHGVEKFIDSFVPQLFHSHRRGQLKEEIEALRAIARTTPKESLIAYTQAMQHRKDRLEVLKHFRKPVLYLVGEEDQTVSLEDSKRQVRALSNYEVHILKETAHMAMYERPQESLEAIRHFVHYIYDKKRSS